jgi:dsRNA-specific ribonuclease
MHADALASVPRALTALVYQRRSLPTARKVAHAFFMSRAVDLRPMLKFTNPKKALAPELVDGVRERPVSRWVHLCRDGDRALNVSQNVEGDRTVLKLAYIRGRCLLWRG